MAMTPELSPAGAKPRYRMVVSRSALIGACALLAAACGSTSAPGSGSAGTGSASTVSSAKVSLDVSFSPAPGQIARHWTLRCEPSGGSYPRAAAACAKLIQDRNLFSPPPSGHVMCPMIMASAQKVTVDGTYFGKKVHETIVDGGCQLSRWYKLRQIFN